MPFRLSKNDILHFCKNAEGLGEQRVNTFAPQMSAINGCPHLLRCGFPKFNPQSEFTSDEENSTFQGIFMPMERTVYTYSNLVKILILTKGVDFFDTLRHGISFLEMSCLFLYSPPSNTAARISANGSIALCTSSLVLV